MAATQLTAELARSLLDYDPSTGVLTWKGYQRRSNSAGGLHKSTGYRRTSVLGKTYSDHRLVWLLVYGVWPKHEIDHINGIRDDNRIANLREVPHRINQQNQRAPKSHNKAGFLGVRKTKNVKKDSWVAKIVYEGKQHLVGYYDTPEEAHAAYLEAKRRLHEGCTI